MRVVTVGKPGSEQYLGEVYGRKERTQMFGIGTFFVAVFATALSIALIVAPLKLFSIDRTLKEIRQILAETPHGSPEPYSPEAFAAARRARARS